MSVEWRANQDLNFLFFPLPLLWLLFDKVTLLTAIAAFKGIRIPESNEFFLWNPDSRKFFARGIQNLGLWNPEYISRNPESKFHWQRIRNPVPGIRNPWRGVQNPRLYWMPLHAWGDCNLNWKRKTRVTTEPPYNEVLSIIAHIPWWLGQSEL